MPALGLALGLPFGAGAAFVGALDAYATSLNSAWSVSRRLLSSYSGPLIRVRETGGSTEADIRFNAAGNLDLAALATHVGSNSGFITKIYSQVAPACDLVQSTAGRQFRIVNAGAVDYFNSGSVPCAATQTNSTQGMETATFTALTGSDYTLASVFRVATANVGTRVSLGGSRAATFGDDGSGGTGSVYVGVTGPTSFEGGNRAVLALSVPYARSLAFTVTSAGHTLRTTAVSNTSAFTTGSKNIEKWLCLYNLGNPTNSLNAQFCEGFVWTANRDSDMATVLAEMNTFYGL